MKAIVFGHERGGTYVMDREGSFRFVKGHTARPVGSEVDINTQAPITFMRIASIAACFMLVLSLSLFVIMWNTVDYSVYVDINPSIELEFNSFDKLKSAIPLNEDGAKLLEVLKLKGSVSDIVLSLINAAEQEGYLINDGDNPAVLVTVVARGRKTPEAYISAIRAILDEYWKSGIAIVEGGNTDSSNAAAELGVSPGKLNLAEKLVSESDNKISLDEALSMTVRQLYAAIHEAETTKDEPTPQPDFTENNNPNAGSGNNSGNNDKPDNPNAGPGNNSGNDDKPDNPNEGPGNNSGNDDKPDNPNEGPGNNSGNNDKPDNPNAGPGNNSGNNDKPDNPNAGPGNNSGNNDKPDNPNAGPGNNSGNNDKPDNPNAGPENNSGNSGQSNPNSGPGNNNGNPGNKSNNGNSNGISNGNGNNGISSDPNS